MNIKNDDYIIQSNRNLRGSLSLTVDERYSNSGYGKTNRTREDNQRSPVGQVIFVNDVNDNDKKIFSFKYGFTSTWGLPEDIVESGNESQVVDFIARQLKNPKYFLDNIKNFHDQIELEIHGEIELKDGRRFFYQIEYEKNKIGQLISLIYLFYRL